MRKLIVVLTALCMVFGFAMSAMAANQVEVKTNSEGITGVAMACEKAGNITFIFDQGTVLRDGDWITADLPLGVTICHSFDFVVLGLDAAGGAAAIPTIGSGSGMGFTGAIAAPADTGTTTEQYLWAVKDVVGADGNIGAVTIVGNDMFFRVRGTEGSSRIRIDVYDEEATGIADAANVDGDSTFTVGPGAEFQLKLFDSNPHDGVTLPTNGDILALNDRDADGLYGDGIGAAGVLAQDVLKAAFDWDNTYCITVDAATYSGSTVNVSINSGGRSGNNFLTFNPSNPQVAHIIAATTIALDACKGDLYEYVPFAGGQTAECSFQYMTGQNYCDFGGNTLLLENRSGTFFNLGDEYRIRLSVSGNGAYFGAAAPAAALKFLPTEDACVDPGLAIGAAWTVATETAVAPGALPSGAGCQPIPAASRYVSLTSDTFTDISDDNVLRVDVPVIVYDPAMFDAGDQVTVTIELWRLPCGLIFTGTRIVAEFVDTCAAAAPTTTLYYPYAVALDGSQGWWFGLTIGNPGTAAGTALVTVIEMDGDVGTYTTPSIAAGGLVVYGASTLLGNLTAAAGNAGTLGDSPCHIVVVCQFGNAGGFGMCGNGTDSTGYTAYTDSNMWNN